MHINHSLKSLNSSTVRVSLTPVNVTISGHLLMINIQSTLQLTSSVSALACGQIKLGRFLKAADNSLVIAIFFPASLLLGCRIHFGITRLLTHTLGHHVSGRKMFKSFVAIRLHAMLDFSILS